MKFEILARPARDPVSQKRLNVILNCNCSFTRYSNSNQSFLTYYQQSTTLEQDQNVNEQLQSQQLPASEAKKSSGDIISEASAMTSKTMEETATAPQLQISNIESQTKTMEVHHHPKVKKKNFKEYLLEGLMIFLAVVLGFFAENVREKITEHERAKIYAATMVNDLGADTAALKNYLSYWNFAANNVDTLFQLLSAAEPNKIPSGKLYWFGLFGGAPRIFIPNDATFQQMKSAGTLRYFSNNLMEKVAEYDQLIRRMRIYDDQDKTIYTEVRKVRSQIFFVQFNDAANNVFQLDRTSPDWRRIDSFIQTNPPLLSNDKAIFNQYLELVRSRFMHAKVRDANELLLHATELLHDLEKEYHLK